MDANLIKNNDLHGMAHRFLTFSSFFYGKWLTNVAIVCTQQLRNRNQACIVVNLFSFYLLGSQGKYFV